MTAPGASRQRSGTASTPGLKLLSYMHLGRIVGSIFSDIKTSPPGTATARSLGTARQNVTHNTNLRFHRAETLENCSGRCLGRSRQTIARLGQRDFQTRHHKNFYALFHDVVCDLW